MENHEMKLRHAPFEKIRAGTKTVELRLLDEKRAKIRANDTVTFTDTETGERLTRLVTGVFRFPSFAALYAAFDKTSLGYEPHETADPADMEAYYPPEEIEKYGAAAIVLAPERE